MTFERLAIAGLVMIVPRRFGDARGYFIETYNERDFAAAGIGADLRAGQSVALAPSAAPSGACTSSCRRPRRPSLSAC